MRYAPALTLLSIVGCSHSNHGGGGGGGGGGGVDAPSSLPNGVFAIPLVTPSGQDQGSFYAPTLSAGGKSFVLDVDTGSTVTGIAGTGCTTCTGISPLYAPGAGANDMHKTDQASYADGSGWSGEIYADMVGLGHGSPDVSLDFVDISSQQQFFNGNEDQGILGIGPDALLDPGTTSYFTKLTGAGVAKTMAFELCPTGGTMWLGGYDQDHVAAAPQYTPILTSGANSSFYSVNLTGMAVGGADLGVSSATFASPIVDTGTSLFYVPNAAETALIAKINASAGFKALFPNQTLTDPTSSSSGTAGCVTAAAGTTDAMVDQMLPKLTYSFAGVGGGTIAVDAAPLASYFVASGGGQYCLGIYGGGDMGQATMGDTFMRAFVTIIDLEKGQVGFAPTSRCAAPALPTAHLPHEHGRGPHHFARSR